MANNNYPQITSVTSEALQAQIRTLLPSQEGFGTDLMAQNVIVPIIDLTSAAEGSSVPQYLQTALAFGSQTAFSFSGATSGTIISNTGFYRIIGTAVIRTSGSVTNSIKISGTDGLSTKDFYEMIVPNYISDNHISESFDFTVFVAAGVSITATSSDGCSINGSTRQVADINGVLVNPSGFNPQ